MLLSAVSVLVVAQSSSEIPEGLMNNPVHNDTGNIRHYARTSTCKNVVASKWTTEWDGNKRQT